MSLTIQNTTTPVIVLQCELGALCIMRSLGTLGVDVYAIITNRKSIATRSRYCHGVFEFDLENSGDDEFVDFLTDLSEQFETRPLLIATSDEMAIFVAENGCALSENYLIAQNIGSAVRQLADKMEMMNLAREHGLPTPHTLLPKTLDEAIGQAGKVTYPVMLKGVMGNRLQQKSGKKMVQVNNEEQYLDQIRRLFDPEIPNVMIQELIPGEDDQVFIFNGYFDKESRCVAAFTGRKIRQFPIHVGCASMGECCDVPEVAQITIDFMRKIGYQGILDIGYRLDPRDGEYKVLDINPRVGQAFRIFLSTGDVDVVRACYLVMTGQAITADVSPREGRRWVIEDFDLVSTYDYYREGSLSFGEWIRSFKKVEEFAWFSVRDPIPFFIVFSRMVGRRLRKIVRRR